MFSLKAESPSNLESYASSASQPKPCLLPESAQARGRGGIAVVVVAVDISANQGCRALPEEDLQEWLA